MDFDNKTRIAYPEGANTNDIIKAMIEILPTGIEQVKNSEKFIFKSTGKPYMDGIAVCRYIRKKVQYKKDGLQNQNIQLPGRFLNGTQQGDCKSFSLAFASIMNALGYNTGFRFASYSKNKIPTHVYNFVCVNGKKLIFDACVENLKESNAYTYIEDSPMKINYLSEPQFIERPNVLKKITMAPARIAFLALVRLNFKGLATKYVKIGVTESKKFWEEFGGDWDALRKAIEAGKNKKSIGGGRSSTGSSTPLTPSRMTADGRRTEAGIQRDLRGIQGASYYISEEGGEGKGAKLEDITKFLGPAAVIIEAVVKLFKKKNVEDPEGLTTEELPLTKEMPEGDTTTFKPSPMLIGGGIAAALLLFYLLKKK